MIFFFIDWRYRPNEEITCWCVISTVSASVNVNNKKHYDWLLTQSYTGSPIRFRQHITAFIFLSLTEADVLGTIQVLIFFYYLLNLISLGHYSISRLVWNIMTKVKFATKIITRREMRQCVSANINIKTPVSVLTM